MIRLRRSYVSYAVLAGAVILAFGASITASFQFDDHALLTDAAVTSPSGWRDVWRPEQTRPLTYFTFWLDYALWGQRPAPYHLFNLLVHLASALLLYSLLSKLIPGRRALVAAAIFAIHPIQTEPVVYIYARGTLLMTPLAGADGEIYAVAQGPLSVGGFGAEGAGGSRAVTNHLTVARIPNGALVERELPVDFARGGRFELSLEEPDFTTAQRVVEAIQTKLGRDCARQLDAATVEVISPDTTRAGTLRFLAQVEELTVTPATPARSPIRRSLATPSRVLRFSAGRTCNSPTLAWA